MKVGMVVGSDSDLPAMMGAVEVLDRMGIEWDLRICSAHRSPEQLKDYALRAHEEGFRVIIAAAGLAAHLAGAIAANTVLPVIGVPLSGSPLGGVDALYSTVQMPPGVPVATVGIDNSQNAALLAAEIIALTSDDLRKRLLEFKEEMSRTVACKCEKLQRLGPEAYIAMVNEANKRPKTT